MRKLRNSSMAVLILMLTAGAALAQEDTQQQDPEQQPTQQNGVSHSNGTAQRPEAGSQEKAQSGDQAASAGDECQVVQEDLEQQIAEDPELRAKIGAGVLRDLRGLRDAALSLERHGQIEACNAVASAMYEIMEGPSANTQTSTNPVTAPDDGGTADPASIDWRESWTNQREEAVSIGEMQGGVRAEAIIGTDVRDGNNDNIGEVADVVFGGGDSQNYLIVAYGGFLGVGEERAAVPMDAAQISQNGDVIFLPLTREELEQAPTFQQGDYDWLTDETWRQENEEFYSRG